MAFATVLIALLILIVLCLVVTKVPGLDPSLVFILQLVFVVMFILFITGHGGGLFKL